MNYIIGGLILFIILYFGRYKLEHIILLNKILENSHDGYWIYYDNRDVSWWSKQNYQLLGLADNNQTKDKNFFPTLIHPKYRKKFEESIESLKTHGRYQIVLKVKHSNGKYIWIQTSGTKYVMPIIKKSFTIGYNRDVSDLYEIAHEVKYLAFHDRSTNTLNSEGLKRRFEELKSSIQYQDSFLTIIDLSITSYQSGLTDKSNNEFLNFFVERLKSLFIYSKMARISEHQFAILTHNLELNEIKTKLELLNNLIHNGIVINNYSFSGQFKAFCMELYPIEPYEQYLVYYEYVKRHLIKDKNEFFVTINASTKEKYLESIRVRNEFIQGLANDELVLYFQPIVNAKTNIVSKLEALIRWNHPNRGTLAPGSFLPYLYEISDIKQLDFWVLKEVLRTIHQYDHEGVEFPKVSINITGVTLADETLVKYIEDNLKFYEVDAHKICIEVTEQILIDNITIGNKNLETLKKMGVQIVLDDFGTGYSSIHYVNQLNAQVIKIDRSFIKDIHQNKKTQAIVKLIRNLADDLAVELVAEGIETYDELSYVLDNYCELVQGYLISKPLPIEEILNNDSKLYKFQ